jgi:DNA-binding NarL/FixJ family response regulator
MREAQILQYIAAGKSNRAIADALFLSPRTVERHIANLYLKLDVQSKAEATAAARHYGRT